jgi:undecaprenyl pyrophosphate phosphatase UppP
MFVAVFLMFSVAYLALGTDRAFKPESYDVSGAWIAISIVLGLIAAVVGGVVCVAVAKNPKASIFLAVVVIVLGVLLALPALMSPNGESPGVRTGDVGNMEAMSKAKTPTWISLVNPVIGAVGVLIGGGIRKNRRSA